MSPAWIFRTSIALMATFVLTACPDKKEAVEERSASPASSTTVGPSPTQSARLSPVASAAPATPQAQAWPPDASPRSLRCSSPMDAEFTIEETIDSDGRFVAFTTWPDRSIWMFDRERRCGGRIIRPPASGASLSDHGRIVAFSTKRALLPKDTNKHHDVYALDLWTGALRLASVSPAGRIGNEASGSPTISGDGTRVFFTSRAANLAPGGATTCKVAVSGHGKPVDRPCWQVFVHDLRTGRTQRLTSSTAGGPAHGSSRSIALSGDATVVAFESDASDLIAGDTNDSADVFVVDLHTGTIELISLTSSEAPLDEGGTGPWISRDGATVLFASHSDIQPDDEACKDDDYAEETHPCIDLYIRDRANGTTTLVPRPDADEPQENQASGWALSGDGKVIAYHFPRPTEFWNSGPLVLIDWPERTVSIAKGSNAGDEFIPRGMSRRGGVIVLHYYDDFSHTARCYNRATEAIERCTPLTRR